MFRKLLFLSAFLLTQAFSSPAPTPSPTPTNGEGGGSATITGSVGGCGATYQTLGDFYTVFENTKNKESSVRNTFSGFNCGETNTGGTYILNSIDFETGDYTCINVNDTLTASEQTGNTSSKVHGNIVSKANPTCSTDIENLYKQIENKSLDIKQPKPAKVIEGANSSLGFTGNFGQNFIGFFPTNYWSEKGNLLGNKKEVSVETSIGLDFASMKKTIEEIKKNANKVPNTSINKIDTAKNNNITFAELLTGLITLDTDYFKDGMAITASGKANLKFDNLLTYKNLERIEKEGEVEGNFQYFTALENYINANIWGFYIAFIENMRAAETYVILFFFGIGFFGLVGQKMIQTGYASVWKEDSREDLNLKKMVTGPLIMLATFTAPIVPSQMTVPAEYLNETTDVSAGIVLNSGSSTAIGGTDGGGTEDIQNSTIIQAMIRYFAHFGVISANKFADYGLYPYLKYLQQELYGNYKEAADEYNKYLIDFQKDLLILQKEFEFYQYFCRPIYSSINDDFSTIQAPGIKNSMEPDKIITTQNSNAVAKEILQQGNIAADTISYNLCSNLGASLEAKSSLLVTDYNYKLADLQLLAKQQEARANKTTSSKSNLLNRVLVRTVENQEQFGWINSVIIPATYIALTADEMRDAAKEKRETKAAQEIENRGVFDDIIDTTKSMLSPSEYTENFLKEHSHEFAYFLFPGFTNMFNFVYEALEATKTGLAVAGISVASTILGPGKFLKIGKKAFAKAKQVIKPLRGKQGKGKAIAGATTVGAGIWAATKVYSAYLAFGIATSLYMFALSILSTSIAIILLLTKTAFYFIELLFFFIASPVVVIWSVIQNKTEAIWNYIGRGLVLCITPILIVLSVYTFIFSVETFMAIFNAIMAIFESLFLDGGDSFSTDMQGIGVQIVLYALIQFVIIMTAFIVIYKFPSWFLSTVGAKTSTLFEEGTTHFREATFRNLKSPIA